MPEYSSNDYFRMGAAVAIGELYESKLLDKSCEDSAFIKEFLGSFGIHSIEDLQKLGMGSIYLEDFAGVL